MSQPTITSGRSIDFTTPGVGNDAQLRRIRSFYTAICVEIDSPSMSGVQKNVVRDLNIEMQAKLPGI